MMKNQKVQYLSVVLITAIVDDIRADAEENKLFFNETNALSPWVV